MTPSDTVFMRAMTPTDFAALGSQQVAYVKPVTANGQPAYAIHSADGTLHLVVESIDKAVAVVRQNDLEPVSVH